MLFRSSYSSGASSKDKISRKDVPSKINEFKKGASREVTIKRGVMTDVTKKKK